MKTKINTTKMTGVAIAACVAGAFAFAIPTIATANTSVPCYGANSCKGMSVCKTAANDSCSGKNSCKGKGMIMADSQDACTKLGGSLTDHTGGAAS